MGMCDVFTKTSYGQQSDISVEHETFVTRDLINLKGNLCPIFTPLTRRTVAQVHFDSDKPRRACLRASISDQTFRSTRALPRLSIHRVDLSPHDI